MKEHLETSEWLAILQDDTITKPIDLKLFKTLCGFEGAAAPASEVAEVMNTSYQALNLEVGRYAKRIAKKHDINFEVRKNKKEKFWDLLFTGWYREDKKFVWKIKENLLLALKKSDILHNSDLKYSSKPKHSSVKAFLFSYNPDPKDSWVWEEIEDAKRDIRETGSHLSEWNISAHKQVEIGDRAFVMSFKNGAKGIFASGKITSSPYKAKTYREGKTTRIYRVNIELDILLNPETEALLSQEILREKIPDGPKSVHLWSPQSSGMLIKPAAAEKLEGLWYKHIQLPLPKSKKALNLEQKEGKIYYRQTRSYERNPYLRQACIAHYGLNCSVCDFNFEAHYGEVGRDFIHVHHLMPLAEHGERPTDPIADMRPVCPNCHAMLHKASPPLTIEELQQRLQK